ncbi:MAG TPA: type II secretion system protein GspL [Gammaproteobacteria bacterium]|nr:type II secretion system protein GspL [Gammaproteobacteria bacterium]
MREKLVIYLHTHDYQRPSWAIVNAEGIVRQHAIQDDVRGLAQIGEEKEIIVIIPAEDVLLMTSKLPKMNRSRLRQALPYALEEQLIADVETLHVVIAHDQGNDHLPVAIVAHQKMQQWLALLQAWGIKPDVLIPASLVLPWENGKWSVLIQDTAVIRTGMYQGWGCDKNNFNELFTIALSLAVDIPQQVNVRHDGREKLSLSFITNENILQPEQWIRELAIEAAKVLPINLLQHIYRVKKVKFLQANKVWRVIAYLSAIFIFLLFLYPTVSYVLLKQRLITMDKQMSEIYKKQFPQASSMVAPKQRIEEKLQHLQGQEGKNQFLLLASYVGMAMRYSPNITLKHMDFQNNQLTIELIAETADRFSMVNNFLIQQKLRVKQQNISVVDSHVHATLVVDNK